MNKVQYWFSGTHTSGPAHKAAQVNRERARSRIAPVVVTPDELLSVITAEGIGYHESERLVTYLLDKAETEALSRTFAKVEPEEPKFDPDAHVWRISWIMRDGSIGSKGIRENPLFYFDQKYAEPDVATCVLIQRRGDQTKVIRRFP